MLCGILLLGSTASLYQQRETKPALLIATFPHNIALHLIGREAIWQIRPPAINQLNPQYVRWSSDGHHVAMFGISREHLLSLYVAAFPELQPQFIASVPIRDVAWSSDGQKLAYIQIDPATSKPQIKVITPDGNVDRIYVLHDIGVYELNEHALAWSPDDTHLAFLIGNQIGILDVQTSQYERFATSTNWIVELAWSPDNQWIAFAAYTSDVAAVFRIRMDGTAQELLTPYFSLQYLAAETTLAWSPDGRFVVFVGIARDSNHSSLYRIDMSQRRIMRISDTAHHAINPTWSPDGEWIYFVAAVPPITSRTLWQIYRLRPDGSGQEPVFSPFDALNYPQVIPFDDHLAHWRLLIGVSVVMLAMGVLVHRIRHKAS